MVPDNEDTPVENPPAEANSNEEASPNAPIPGEDTSPSSDGDADPATEEVLGDGPDLPPADSAAEGNPEATDAGNENAPTGVAPEEENRTSEMMLNSLLSTAKEAAKETLQLTARELLELSRTTIMTVIGSNELPEHQAKAVLQIYASAEQHALAGRAAHSKKMIVRAMNLIKSHKLVVKAEKIEAAGSYISSVLGLLSSAATGFIGNFGGNFVKGLSDIAESAVDDLLKKLFPSDERK